MKLSELERIDEMYSAYVLSDESRRELLEKFPPKFPDVVAHHVTEKFGVKEDASPPPLRKAKVIGYANDSSLEALVVELDGSTKRPDGSVYHITWSLDRSKGRKPVDSNRLLKGGFTEVDPVSIEVDPKILK